MHHKKCKNGGFRAFSLKQNVVIVRCESSEKKNAKLKLLYLLIKLNINISEC